jgi:glutamyl-tRNA reductase
LIDGLAALVLHAAAVPVRERTDYGARLAARALDGLLLRTCHRVELYGQVDAIAPLAADAPAGTIRLAGTDAARHLVRLAVGLESAVVAEDQVLHQLRRAMSEARSRGKLQPIVDRLGDLALRSGRRARTWLPPGDRGLAEQALGTLPVPAQAGARAAVLVVGAGEMGARIARAAARRGLPLVVASRTPERAAALAAGHGGQAVPFDPGPGALAGMAGVIVALAGHWPLGQPSIAALVAAETHVVDLSAPSALEPALAHGLGSRLTTIDDLAVRSAPPSRRLLERLEMLVEETLADWQAWAGAGRRRDLAQRLAERAAEARQAELGALWRRLPDLELDDRMEVERMARHLAERLLREPLEVLAAEDDEGRLRAARELFRL